MMLQNIFYRFYLPSFQNFQGVVKLEWNVNMVYALFISL